MITKESIITHLINSTFVQRTKSLFYGNSLNPTIDIKLLDLENNIVVYIYDKGMANVMTIIGKVENISENKQD